MDKEHLIILLVLAVIVYKLNEKSNFNVDLVSSKYTNDQPMSFTPLTSPIGKNIPLASPTVPEEIGLGYVYPQGAGSAMSPFDSDSFAPGNTLLTQHLVPQSYGDSNFIDPVFNDGSKIIKLRSAGQQDKFKPMDSNIECTFASHKQPKLEVAAGSTTMIPGNEYINYSDSFKPEDHLKIQNSPGKEAMVSPCEDTYPRAINVGKYCVTAGDIPYGQVVNGRVNPRLVSRWESYTGKYNPQEALQGIDGTLYPRLAIPRD